jgi:hypothetical protein
MIHRHVRTSFALAFIPGSAAAARAQDVVAARTLDIFPIVTTSALTPALDQSRSIAAVRSNTSERRPPQAPLPDPSKDQDAPPDAHHIRRAVGGFVGGLIGLGACSLVARSDGDPRAGCVAIGILVGTSIGGR